MDNKSKGIIGTILFHGLVLVCFLFFGFKTPLPLPEEEGVEIGTDVNLGNSETGFGDIQPLKLTDNSQNKSSSASKSDYLSQNTDETDKIDNSSTKPNNSSNDNVSKVNDKAIYKGKNKSTSNQGISGGSGDQGNPNGDPNSKNYKGYPGDGNSISFNLTNRKAKVLPAPSYDSDEQGKVVVEVIVDTKGKVIKAKAGIKGTTIIDKKLWNQAEKAAMSSSFDSKEDAAIEQKGTITYIFLKLN